MYTSTLTSRPIILPLSLSLTRQFLRPILGEPRKTSIRVALRSIEAQRGGKRERESAKEGKREKNGASERVSVRDRDKNWRARTRDFLVSLFFPLYLKCLSRVRVRVTHERSRIRGSARGPGL